MQSSDSGLNAGSEDENLDIVDMALPASPIGIGGDVDITTGALTLATPVPVIEPEVDISTLRDFADPVRARDSIYSKVLDAVQKIEPVANDRFTLRLSGADYIDDANLTKRQQKHAILNNETPSRRLSGLWELVDNATGEVVDKRKSVLMRVPRLTDRGTFIHRGVEYAMKNQQRLRSGVYTRIQSNGEIESHVNVLPGKGQSHRYFVDPAKGVFKIKVQQGTVGMIPLLRAMGVGNAELSKHWGPNILAANAAYDNPGELKKLQSKFLSKKEMELTDDERKKALVAKFESMELDPAVTARTLGSPYSNLSKDALFSISRRLMAVSRGEEEPDDRDALHFQQFYGPEDLFAERIARDKDGLRRQLLWKLTGKGSLKSLPPAALNPQLYSALLTSGLGLPLEEINPIEIFDKMSGITRLGEGGIGSIDAIPKESRSVQPSMLGFVDPLRTPESLRAGVDVYMAQNALKGNDGKIYGKFIDNRTGKIVFKTPEQVADSVVLFPTKDTSSPFRQAMRKGKMAVVRPEEGDLTLAAMDDSFNGLSNIIPLKSQVKGQRLVMATRMSVQALPVENAEAPLVQSAVPGTGETKSFEELYGEKVGAIYASKPGKVVDIQDDQITIMAPDGTEEVVELYRNLPHNRKTLLHQDPLVQLGQTVRPGQLLAKSNFTDKNGAVALGLNARTAYMSWGGANFEDGIVISQEFADRAKSQHAYQHFLETNDNTKLSKKDYVGLFPGKFSRELLNNIDDTGVIKPGTKVQYGDPLVLAISKKEQAHNRVHKRKSTDFGDAAITWDHEDPGVVTDVAMTKKGPLVMVKALSTMKVGDKMCFDVNTSILTSDGWVSVADLTEKHTLATLNPTYNTLEWHKPSKLYCYTHVGSMARISDKSVDQLVTLEHDLWYGDAGNFRKIRAKDFVSMMPTGSFKKNCGWIGKDLSVVFPDVACPASYLYFLVWFSLRGYCVINDSRQKLVEIRISAKSKHRSTILKAMDDLGWRYDADPAVDVIRVYSDRLYDSLVELGDDANIRRLPKELFRLNNMYAKQFLSYIVTDVFDGADAFNIVSGGLRGDLCIVALQAGWALEDDFSDDETLCRLLVTEQELQPAFDAKAADTTCLVKQFSGMVYCVTVRNHLVYVRRNGKVCWSGNSGRYGDKGVIAQIIPTEQMPTDAEGRPFEVLVNPLGIPTRTNPAQLAELWLGKIAEKLGQPIKVEDFQDHVDMSAVVRDKLKEHGLKGEEDIFDPTTGRKVKQIATGNRFFMKLHHSSEGKLSGRAGGAYTMEGLPAKGGPDGGFTNSKRLGMLELNALLSHGALHTIRDAKIVRGQKNEEYWNQFMSGYTPTSVKVPIVYKKFVNQLKASGINVVPDESQVHILAMTDDDVMQLAGGREITSSEGVDWSKGLKEIKGGLFDRSKTGGHDGSYWSYFRLSDPLPNPAMEEPIRRILGLTKKQFEETIAGTHTLGRFGTGSKGMANALSSIDLNAAIKEARDTITAGKKTKRDDAVKRLGYLKAIQQSGLKPSQYMMSVVPVLPPAFRPVSLMSNKMPLVDDANFLYKELFELNKTLSDLKREVGDDSVGEERLQVYKAFKAVTGLGDPVGKKLKDQNVKGILRTIFGSSPKFSTMQRKLISTTVDNVGRGVAIPNPDFDMDSIGLPEDAAFNTYERYVTARLVRQGLPLLNAREHISSKTPLARKALVEEMETRPVLVSRAPALHKFSILAYKPRLVKGSAIQANPTTIKGHNLDFDGDTMNFHAPADAKAVQEAYDRLLPSKNLFKLSDMRTPAHMPVNEYVAGLYHASQAVSNKKPRVFRSAKDVREAYARNEISLDEPIEILESS